MGIAGWIESGEIAEISKRRGRRPGTARSGCHPRPLGVWFALVAGLLCADPASAQQSPEPPRLPPIAIDADWEQLPPVRDLSQVPDALDAAAAKLGDWSVELVGRRIDAALLRAIAERGRREPVLRALREELRRAFDAIDLLRFLDDVLVAGAAGRRGQDFVVTPGRARAVGITVHPDEVFKGRPRDYPAGRGELNVDRPRPPLDFEPAVNGEPLGPRWTARFPNPAGERSRLDALRRRRPEYAQRIESLMTQLRAQGADVILTSTVRPPERGYLMWGAFVLSRTHSRSEMEERIEYIRSRNDAWGLDVPIRWLHPEGSWATRVAAREMADAYEVVYATEAGARASNHYTGVAVDLVAAGLPRRLRLATPDGRAQAEFDLSDPEHTRDLSLAPELIAWLEEHFALRKLRSDYPHWEDATGLDE